MSDNLPPLPEPTPMSLLASRSDAQYTADEMLAFRAEGVAAERKRIRAALMDMHYKTADHNYYAYAANQLFCEKPCT